MLWGCNEALNWGNRGCGPDWNAGGSLHEIVKLQVHPTYRMPGATLAGFGGLLLLDLRLRSLDRGMPPRLQPDQELRGYVLALVRPQAHGLFTGSAMSP